MDFSVDASPSPVATIARQLLKDESNFTETAEGIAVAEVFVKVMEFFEAKVVRRFVDVCMWLCTCADVFDTVPTLLYKNIMGPSA